MNRTVSGIVAAALAVGLLNLPVMAQPAAGPFPAVSRPVCENTYGGVWSQNTSANPNINTCTVASTMVVPGSHPIQAWTVEVSVGVVYTKQGGTETTEDNGAEVTACYNHRGKKIDDFETNPNCQPASSPSTLR